MVECLSWSEYVEILSHANGDRKVVANMISCKSWMLRPMQNQASIIFITLYKDESLIYYEKHNSWIQWEYVTKGEEMRSRMNVYQTNVDWIQKWMTKKNKT